MFSNVRNISTWSVRSFLVSYRTVPVSKPDFTIAVGVRAHSSESCMYDGHRYDDVLCGECFMLS